MPSRHRSAASQRAGASRLVVLLALAVAWCAGPAESQAAVAPGLAPARVLASPVTWFPMAAPSRMSTNLAAAADSARGLPPLACQTLTKRSAGYASATWAGLALPLPANRLLHVPVYLEDFQAQGFSISLTIQLTNERGTISYSFSANAFRPSAWSYIPLWDPATPANAVFSKPGTSGVIADTGFDFAEPVTAITVVPNNLPAGARMSFASIETATRTKPLIVVTDDITNDSTYKHIVPIMEAAGFRGGLRIGGFKETSYAPGVIAPLRKAYDNGWDVYNGSWSRGGFNGASTAALFESEILECQDRAKALGFTRGMTWFSGAGNALPSESVGRSVAAKLGLKVLKGGGGLGQVNIIRAAGLEFPAIVTCCGMGGAGARPATGRRGEVTLALSAPWSLREGASVTGAGIGAGARIAPHGIRGNTVTLTLANTGDVAGPVTITDSLEAHLAMAEGLLYTGGALVYFMHDLKPAGEQSNISFPIDDFARLVAYWKARSDQGLLEVVTPTRFEAIMNGER